MKDKVFDPLRKKYVTLTPEEQVRQYFIQWLSKERNYPLSLMMSEYPIEYNTRKMRCDIVCFNRGLQPVLIVECKSPMVKLDSLVTDQIAKYNLVLRVDILIITNGYQTYAYKYDQTVGKYEPIDEIPYYNPL